MKKILLVIANYPDKRQELFEQYFSPKNKLFAEKYGYEYIVSKGADKFRDNVTWWKFTIVKNMIQDGTLKNGDKLLHLDADMAIHNMDCDYPSDKNFTYAICNGNTHCMGNYMLTISDWSKQLINNILDEDLWNLCKNTELWKLWREQAAWYTLSGVISGVSLENSKSFISMKNYGWHTTQDPFFKSKIKYSLEELHDNVKILDPRWNTTMVEEDADSIPPALMCYNIIKTKKSDTIIRHFAGGQGWRMDY
jgi:hypothetical protein